jgi:hypothetical protein
MEGKQCGWFSAPTCSIDYVIHIVECTQAEAELIILDGIVKLQNQDFSRRLSMWGDVADEYGLEAYLGYNWYVKFMIESGELEQISFHPCEKDMNLANGRTIAAAVGGSDLPSWRK